MIGKMYAQLKKKQAEAERPFKDIPAMQQMRTGIERTIAQQHRLQQSTEYVMEARRREINQKKMAKMVTMHSRSYD